MATMLPIASGPAVFQLSGRGVYYGAAAGFEQVLDLVDDACQGLTSVLLRMLAGKAGSRARLSADPGETQD